MRHRPSASNAEVVEWISAGIFRVCDGAVFKGDRQLAFRENLRKRCDHGDARIDLCHDGKRRSIHVSQMIWMANTLTPIPDGFEIHHINEDVTDNSFDNLVCVHAVDHQKFHRVGITDDTPF